MRSLDRLLQAKGSHIAEVVWHAFTWDPAMRHDYRWNRRPWLLLQRMTGYDDVLIHAAESLGPRLTTGPAEARAHAVWMLAEAGERALAAYAGPSPRRPQPRASRFGTPRSRSPSGWERWSRRRCGRWRTTGKPEQRAHALRLLWELGGDGRRGFVSEHGAADRAASVREAVAGLEESPAKTTLPDWWQLPEPTPVQWAVEWTHEVEEVIGRVVATTTGIRQTSGARERLTPDELLLLVREQLHRLSAGARARSRPCPRPWPAGRPARRAERTRPCAVGRGPAACRSPRERRVLRLE